MLFPDIPCFNLCMQSSLQLVLVPWKQAPCSYATLPGQALSAQRSMQQTPAGFANAPAVCDDITRRVLALPQVVVVVTSRWDVLCFDHNLRLMWTGRVKVSCAFPAPIIFADIKILLFRFQPPEVPPSFQGRQTYLKVRMADNMHQQRG
jgi:hypothetical protein